MEFPLSQKYIDFLNTVENVNADILEGTTASGKTTVGAVKFMRMVSRSPKKLHLIAARSVGIAEKNIIQQENGILSIFPQSKYFGNGDKNYRIPHVKFEDKIIFVIGYDSREKWQMVLGSQFGCVFIDEMNIAHMDLLREVSTRNEYMLATLNPDDPALPVYKEFINRARPYKKYEKDVPAPIMKELIEPEAPRWRYWFFSFEDNAALTEEEIERKKASAPVGTKLYKNKIEGLRCRATGLIFGNFEYSRNVRNATWVKEQLEYGKRFDNKPGQERGFKFNLFTAGLDTAYSDQSDDTISMIFQGITDTGLLITLDEYVFNNKDAAEPLAPTDTVRLFLDFLERNRKDWGFARFVFIDSADQATMKELQKYRRRTGTIYTFENAYKKLKIIDRIILMRGWIQEGQYIVLDHCKEHLGELGRYSYEEDKGIPEDRNDHTINASQYAWIPYIKAIGKR